MSAYPISDKYALNLHSIIQKATVTYGQLGLAIVASRCGNHSAKQGATTNIK